MRNRVAGSRLGREEKERKQGRDKLSSDYMGAFIVLVKHLNLILCMWGYQDLLVYYRQKHVGRKRAIY